MEDQKQPERKPAVRIVPAKELRPDTLNARDYVNNKLGNGPRTKDDINAELLGLDRL